MRGLLRKDFYYMKDYRKVILIVVIFCGVFMATMGEASVAFGMGYATLLMSMAVLNTMSYDEENRGMSFLMALPVSRTDYVKEKYMFGFLMGFCGWILGILWMIGGSLFHSENPFQLENLWISLVFLGFLFLSQAVMIPIQLKFGAEKGRMIVILVMMLLIVGGVKIVDIMMESDILTMERIQLLLENAFLPVILAAVILAVYAASFLISVHIMKKKEF